MLTHKLSVEQIDKLQNHLRQNKAVSTDGFCLSLLTTRFCSAQSGLKQRNDIIRVTIVHCIIHNIIITS